jgi:hypothetical protein
LWNVDGAKLWKSLHIERRSPKVNAPMKIAIKSECEAHLPKVDGENCSILGQLQTGKHIISNLNPESLNLTP